MHWSTMAQVYLHHLLRTWPKDKTGTTLSRVILPNPALASVSGLLEQPCALMLLNLKQLGMLKQVSSLAVRLSGLCVCSDGA
jgi:hypothetical protein